MDNQQSIIQIINSLSKIDESKERQLKRDLDEHLIRLSIDKKRRAKEGKIETYESSWMPIPPLG